jgi:hypothetical protein
LETKEFTTAIAELADVEGEYEHPLLTRIKFILTTNEPYNLSTSKRNMKQGIKEEDFDDVIRTGVGMPIKMRYLRNSVGTHAGSIPIGHISKIEKTELENGVKALAAEGVLYTSEYPEEVDYLKVAYAAKQAPGISYEIRHDADKSIIENGVEWIKDLITQAATIVRSPAYGNRTAILALASNKELSTEELNDELRTLITPKDADKGGKLMDEKDEKEIARLTALAAEKENALTEVNAEVEKLRGELKTALDDLAAANTKNGELEHSIKLETRARSYAEAGLTFDEDAEKAKTKKELLAKMDEEVFAAYLADLKEFASKKSTTAMASAPNRGVPRLTAQERDMPLDDLKEALRGISRT